MLPALEATQEATRGVGVEATEAGRIMPALMRLVGPTLTRPSWEYQGNLGLLWVAAAALAPMLRRGASATKPSSPRCWCCSRWVAASCSKDYPVFASSNSLYECC